MKNLLENVIRTILFEQRGVGKIQRVALSQSEMQQAKKSGAVFAYKVITRNAKTDAARLELVRGATLASVNSTDNRMAVGADGKFGDGNYVYVVDQAVGDGNRQESLVRIFPYVEEKPDDVKIDHEIVGASKRIGKSFMVTLAGYNAILKQRSQNQIPDIKTDNSVLDRNSNSNSDVVNTNKDAQVTTPDSETRVNTIQYPFDWEIENYVHKVYTMAPTDPYVYFHAANWWYVKKSDFEANYNDFEKVISLRKPLNKKGIQNIEAKIGKTFEFDRETPTIVPEDENKTKVKKLNALKASKTSGVLYINIDATPVYDFNKTSKQWVKKGDYNPKDNQYIAYLGSSTDYKYVLVKFVKDQKKYWIPIGKVK